MNNNVEKPSPLQEQFAEAFSHLREQEIEQFYAQYQLWSLRRRVPLLEGQISTMREHLAENQQMIQSLQPSALAMAVLARLQSNGVSDVDVLDRMLERGEGWLDKMMQRLDYCEQVEDFIQGDYTQWCINSLDGAYDWLDPVLNPATEEDASAQPAETESETTEEMVLQRLSLEDEEAMQQSIQASVYEPEADAQEIPIEAEAAASTEEAAQASTIEAEAEEAAPLSAETGAEPEAREDVTETEQTPETSAQETPIEAEAAAELASAQDELAPWYSVNLDENAASDAGSQDAMNDWIKVLQADTGESPAVSEIQAAQAEAAIPEAAEITAEELPIPELEDEAEHTYFTEEAQAETAYFANETQTETVLAEQEQMPAESAISAEAEQMEEAATQPTDETAPAPAEIETVDSAQATELPAPAEEAEASSPDDPVEAEQPPEEVEQAEPVLVEEQSAATEQVTASDDTEMAETSPAEQEAAPDESLPLEDQASFIEIETAPLENEAAPDEAVSLEDQASFIETVIPAGQEVEPDEPLPIEDQASFIEDATPAEKEQGEQPPALVVASETAEESSVLAETSGQVQMEENRKSEQELEELGDWQTWSMNQDDDKTEPMALRAIQSSLELEPTVKLADLAKNATATPADSTEEGEATPREAASEPAMLNAPEQHAAALVPAQTEYFEEPAGPVEAQTGWPASHEQAQSAAPGEQPVTPLPSPRAQWVTPLPPPEVRPQAKRGFWRRLFGWLRKN